tara:strand:- start:1172 stop:1372 length:201 start_codon:yes stop_codon:yes gene_type:complete
MKKPLLIFILLNIVVTFNINIWAKVNKPSEEASVYNYIDFSKLSNGQWMEANRTDIEKNLNFDDSY